MAEFPRTTLLRDAEQQRMVAEREAAEAARKVLEDCKPSLIEILTLLPEGELSELKVSGRLPPRLEASELRDLLMKQSSVMEGMQKRAREANRAQQRRSGFQSCLLPLPQSLEPCPHSIVPQTCNH